MFESYIEGALTQSDVAGASGSFNGFNFGDAIIVPGAGADLA